MIEKPVRLPPGFVQLVHLHRDRERKVRGSLLVRASDNEGGEQGEERERGQPGDLLEGFVGYQDAKQGALHKVEGCHHPPVGLGPEGPAALELRLVHKEEDTLVDDQGPDEKGEGEGEDQGRHQREGHGDGEDEEVVRVDSSDGAGGREGRDGRSEGVARQITLPSHA